jgi:hypothetical protein
MSLILDGTNGLSDVDGSAATPALRGSDANTGIFFGTDIIGFSEGGVESARFNASGVFTTTNDATIQGLTVGKGAGAVATNTAVGASALAAVTTGANNSASGYFAGKAITDGALNTAFGSNALLTLIGNNANSAFGANAGKSTTAGNNTFVGSSAGFTNSTGGSNVSLGAEALYSNTTASNNTAVGYQAMYSNTTGTGNTAIGSEALYANLVGVSNTAIGYRALLNYASSTNGNNTALGHQTGLGLTTGLSNTFLGAQAGTNNTTGSGNTFVGREGGYFCTTGSGNTVLNPRTGTDSYSPVFALTTENNRMILGSTAVTNAYIQVAWTVVSDLRDKVVLGNVPLGLDFVRKLKPIKYQFKETREGNTPTGAVKYGFGAQDVLAEEGDAPVIIDTEVADKLKITDSHMMPVFANAIKEMADMIDQLKAEIALLKRATP